MEEKVRKAAVHRYLRGEKPKSIYTNLKRKYRKDTFENLSIISRRPSASRPKFGFY